MRPLGIRVSKLEVDGSRLEISTQTLLQKYLQMQSVDKRFRILHQAAEKSRNSTSVSLSDCRGPWSSGLELFIANHVADYDLIVTHNNIFRPAVVAINEAKKHGVPSILIPHTHLDDDFYHFPDIIESSRNASVVLVAPKKARDFLEEKGCNAIYMTPGCDVNEVYTENDKKEFQNICELNRDFILVLGRKAGAKGYKKVIEAVEKLNAKGINLQTVLIGPDDDGVVVDSPNAIYLGRQPRNIVRGALMSCLALCNMSDSESFGMLFVAQKYWDKVKADKQRNATKVAR
jgi:glycosyltransferase involved in cell wall biosynthesis